MRTIEELAAEEHEIACYEEEQRQEAYKLYCAEMDYRGEMTASIPLDRLIEICKCHARGPVASAERIPSTLRADAKAEIDNLKKKAAGLWNRRYKEDANAQTN
jgi:hypothetical protein